MCYGNSTFALAFFLASYRKKIPRSSACVCTKMLLFALSPCFPVLKILDPDEDPEEEEEDGGAQDIDAIRQGKSAVMKTSTRQVTNR